MLKPVTLSVDWQGPYQWLQAIDPSTSGALNAGWPGVYVFVSVNTTRVIARYLGKSLHSVVYRQWEHFEKIVDGEYHLYGQNGTRTFTKGTIKPVNFIDLIEEYVLMTEVYFGQLSLSHTAASGHIVDSIIDSTEGVLLSCPAWASHTGVIINYRSGSNYYKAFDKFEISHKGCHFMTKMFGSQTVWDRSLQKIT
ncbi:hypothetical protein [Nitrospirillum viridazoti]|uniref:hypothetical protein n=1 Tax=Nitrospirillum viridazoti TaxID=3144925 RepID=UPI00110FA5A2|nr:hypothetical protein [Nitrospirillum amazonense]